MQFASRRMKGLRNDGLDEGKKRTLLVGHAVRNTRFLFSFFPRGRPTPLSRGGDGCLPSLELAVIWLRQ